MSHNRACECILCVSVDVHLHYTVAECFADVAELGAGTAVEDQIQRIGLGVAALGNKFLAVFQDLRSQVNVARFVDPVHVAE